MLSAAHLSGLLAEVIDVNTEILNIKYNDYINIILLLSGTFSSLSVPIHCRKIKYSDTGSTLWVIQCVSKMGLDHIIMAFIISQIIT